MCEEIKYVKNKFMMWEWTYFKNVNTILELGFRLQKKNEY